MLDFNSSYGADVSIVGPNYNDGQTIVKQMESVAKDNLERYPQKFDAFAYDLSTVGGCNNYTKLLQNNGLLFDILVLTMGVSCITSNIRIIHNYCVTSYMYNM